VGSLERIREIDTGQLLRRGQQKRVAAASVSHRGVGEDGLERAQDREIVGDAMLCSGTHCKKTPPGPGAPARPSPPAARQRGAADGPLTNQVATSAIPPM